MPRSRFRSWKLIAAALTSALAAVLLAVPQSTALAGAPHAAVSATAATHTVTLVTGDVVTVIMLAGGEQIAEIDRPDHAVGGVRVREVGGDLYVLPDEIQSLLAADRLDRQLFNVTDLIEMGYDDGSAGSIPLIAAYDAESASALARGVSPATPRGSKLVRSLASIQGAALTADKTGVRSFWDTVADPGRGSLDAGLAKLWLDARVEVALADSVPLIGAPQAWDAGLDGTGITVAVLDTGVDTGHPDLAGQIDATASFVPGETIDDIDGHGTHVSSTIVGTGAASDGANKGVAPGADLIVGKVLGNDGFGATSWIVAGMEWAAGSGADVVNMSLGSSERSDGTDPMSAAVNTLSEQYGTLFVVASGNSGSESIGAPAAAAAALTVGATDKSDNLAWFSSTGPMIGGGIKPDLTAPGVDINAARSQQMNDGGSGFYRSISGTSMATPHVAGAAAILAQQYPDWTGAQLKEQLVSTVTPLADWYTPYEVGTGRLDVPAAISRSVRASGPVFFGNFDWPHEPSDAPVTKQVTFTNTGAEEVTLDLTLAGTGGPFALAASTVIVPAGGEAAVDVTGDPTTADYGRFTGYLVGTDAATGSALTRTSLALVKEDERYDLTIKLRDRSGEPASSWVMLHKQGEFWAFGYEVDGELTLRLPPGSYTSAAYLDVPGEQPDSLGLALMIDPETILAGGSQEIILDASKARHLDTSSPQNTEDRQRVLDFERVYPDGSGVRDAYPIPIKYDDLYVMPTEPVTTGEFQVATRWRQGEPMLRLAGKGFDVNAVVQPGSPLTEGSTRSRVVYAGNGAPADYARIDAEGKIVVVERSDVVGPAARAAAAAEAGASMLIVVNDGAGVLNEYVAGATIPVATVHRDLGRQLIDKAKAGRLKLTETRVPYATYLYDLTRNYPGQVPDRPLSYHPGRPDLARIDASFFSARGEVDGAGFRYSMTFSPAVGFRERELYPGTRTEWVTPDQLWHETHTQGGSWEDRGYLDTYARGRAYQVDWFAPMVRPSFGRGYSVRNARYQDYLTVNVQSWSPSGRVIEHGGSLGWGEVPETVKLYAGDTLIDENQWSSDLQWVGVPSERTKFRLVHDASRPEDPWRLSTRSHTEWEFFSEHVASDWFEPLDLLTLDYDLDTDLAGDVRRGWQVIGVKAGPQPGGSGTGKVTSVTLDVSYDDGETWAEVRLFRMWNGWWRGLIKPADQGGFISVRAQAATDAEWSISQEVLRAYGVR